VVNSTKKMDFSKTVQIKFDGSYNGFSDSVLGRLIDI